MIKKKMDVKELCRSELFYPLIWQNYNFFSSIETPVVIPYNHDLEDLYCDDPSTIFNSLLSKEYQQVYDENNLT